MNSQATPSTRKAEIIAKYTIQMERYDSKEKRKVAKDYLQVAGRILCFHEDYPVPVGQILTKLVFHDAEGAVFNASILVEGKEVATGWARATYANSQNFSGRIFEKAETAAIGRALAHAGWGTDAAGDDIDELDEEHGPNHLADSPVVTTPPAQPQPWHEVPEYWDRFVNILKDMGTSVMEGEKLAGQPLKSFATPQAARFAIEAAIEKELADKPPAAAKNPAPPPNPVKPPATKPAPKPATTPAEPPAKRDDDWAATHLSKLEDLAKFFDYSLTDLCKAVGAKSWSEFKSFPEARSAIIQRATEECWAMIARKVAFNTDGETPKITFYAPFTAIWMAGLPVLKEQMQKNGAKSDWSTIIDWKHGDHFLPEPVRIYLSRKGEGLTITRIEPASKPKIGV